MADKDISEQTQGSRQRDYSAKQTLMGLIESAWDFHRKNFRLVVAVKVVRYDRKTREIICQPLVRDLGIANSTTPQTVATTALQYAANGFVVDFPIKKGDCGWVIGADRYTLDAKLSHEMVNPAVASDHQPEYGFFIPDYWGILGKADENEQDLYSGEDDRLVISSFDGRQKLSIGRAAFPGEESSSEGDILITSKKDDGNFTTILVKNGEITVNSTTKVSVSSPVVHIDGGEGEAPSAVDITGTLTVSGDIKTTGGDVTQKDGVVLGTHTHKYNPGSGAATETVKPTTS